LIRTAVEIVKDDNKLNELSKNIVTLAHNNSANIIAEEVFKLADNYRKDER